MTAKQEIHSEALELMGRINKEIPNKERLETLNILMRSVVWNLNNQLIEDLTEGQIQK